MDSDQSRPSFRFRDKFSRLKDRVKEKIRDKAIKHNMTQLIHQNLTSNETADDHRHGFRERMHHMKDILKNKTHYESFKHKLEDKFDLHDNKTYPKGFYDSLFSPETENDVYLQTALICLWCLALLCLIPTLIIIFLPSKKVRTSSNMIFFHVFLCELFYLSYILLAMINVKKDFHLGEALCNFANYGMYVTIPIMQFALLFLSLERLTIRFQLSMTWTKIFSKSYVPQLILCAIWIFLIAALLTVMFIKNQFNFSFVKEQIKHMAPPIIGDVATKFAARRHHCSIDGRLSSIFKTVIIILFIVLIVKPIALSIGFNILTPYCCRKRRKKSEPEESRTTKLVTIFLLLNFFFSFPFYFASMFKSIFTNIDSTKDTFTLVLKICFILRITNIIFECLAFYIFERNSWNLLSRVFYYGTCKKIPMLKPITSNGSVRIKDREVSKMVHRIKHGTTDDDEEIVEVKPKRKAKKVKKPPTPSTQSDEDIDEDGAFVKKSSRRASKQTSGDEEQEEHVKKQTKSSRRKKTSDAEEEQTTSKSRRKSSIHQTESEEEEESPKNRRRSSNKEPEKHTKKPGRKIKREEQTDSDDEEEETPKPQRKSSRKETESEADSQSDVPRRTHKDDDDGGPPVSTHKSRRKSSETKEFISKPKHHHRTSNGTSTSKKPQRRLTPPLVESEPDNISNASPSPKSPRRSHPSSRVKRTAKKPHSTSKKSGHTSKRKSKKDRRTQILEMSDDV